MSLTRKLFRSRSADDREAAALAVLALWRQHAAGFREDERQMEGAEFAERSAAVSPEVAAIPAAAAPEPALLRRMLEVLVPAVQERVELLHGRVDELADACRVRDRELQTLQLAGSWQTDELERCRAMLTEALQGRETVMPSGSDGAAPLVSQLLSLVINIQVPPPRPQASIGRRSEMSASGRQRPAPAEPATAQPQSGDHAAIGKALREVLDGTAQAPKLARALEDQDLARRVADLAAEHRTYRAILQRIGVLPKS